MPPIRGSRSIRLSPKGPSDANDSDHINVHALGRFLRALSFAGSAARSGSGPLVALIGAEPRPWPRPPARPSIGSPAPAAYDRLVTPLLLIGLGFLAVIAAVAIVRSYGHRYRIGRLLAVTPQVSVADAVALARSGIARYVRVDGRIDSEAEFEDSAHRPLVWRRTRIEILEGRGWRTVDDHRQAVPFAIREGLDAIAIDESALDAGLVVLPRESRGRASELAERLPPGTPAGAVVRVRVEQISSVEHAIALGVPTLGPDGRVRLGPGLGRDLVLTTLEPAEAMRVLVEGERLRPAAAAVLFVGGLLAIGGGVLVGLVGLLVG